MEGKSNKLNDSKKIREEFINDFVNKIYDSEFIKGFVDELKSYDMTTRELYSYMGEILKKTVKKVKELDKTKGKKFADLNKKVKSDKN